MTPGQVLRIGDQIAFHVAIPKVALEQRRSIGFAERERLLSDVLIVVHDCDHGAHQKGEREQAEQPALTGLNSYVWHSDWLCGW